MKGDRLGEFEELTLLAVCAIKGDFYGVPVQQFVEKTTGRDVTMGAVYSALDRLEEAEAWADRCAEASKVCFTGLGTWHAYLEHLLETRSLQEMKRAFDDNGLMAPSDVGSKNPSNCYLMLRVIGGKYQKVDDPTTGFRCDAPYFRAG